MNHPKMAKQPLENMEAKTMVVKLAPGGTPPPKYAPVHSFKPSPLQKAELEKGKGERAWVCEATLWACMHRTSCDAHHGLVFIVALPTTILQRRNQTEKGSGPHKPTS